MDFTHALQASAERWWPKMVTVSQPVRATGAETASEVWFAQRLDALIGDYDFTALMAMPGWKGTGTRKVAASAGGCVATHPKGLERTVFELQTVDWRTQKSVSDGDRTTEARRCRTRCAPSRHYPDDVLRASPALPGRAR